MWLYTIQALGAIAIAFSVALLDYKGAALIIYGIGMIVLMFVNTGTVTAVLPLAWLGIVSGAMLLRGGDAARKRA